MQIKGSHMSNFVLLSQIFRGKWLIEPNFAFSQGPLLAGLINGQTAMEPYSETLEDEAVQYAYAIKPGAANVGPYSLKHRAGEIPEGSVAVINLSGPLMKADNCGEPGMATIGNYIKQADNHPNIEKIVLVVDSPGGTVDGTEALANIVKATKTPIQGLVDGMACSAAAWIISACDEVFATNDFDEVGSIGVLLSFADVQGAMEKQGVKFHTIVASTSPDKVKWFEDLRAGKYENYIKEVLNPIDQRFMETIKHNLPNVKEEHLTGKVYFAKDVIGVFVDDIKTLDQILSESIGKAPSGNAAVINNQNHKSMKKLTFLVALFASANLQLEADADGGLFLNAEQLEQVNAALQASDVNQLTTERDNALTAQRTAEGDLAAANARIAELETQLDKKPGATTATAVRATDAVVVSEPENNEFVMMASASDLYKSIKV